MASVIDDYMIRKMMRVYIVLLFVVVNTRTSLTQCKRGEVICNGKCIHKYSVCNEEKLCAPNQFQCTNHKCIIKTQLCDSKDDCGDNSDEINCPTDINAICLSNEFGCDETQCIAKSRHCNGAFDCLNHVDEIGCRPPNITKISDGQALTPGDLLELICETDGVPAPIISWSLNSGHLPAQCTTSSNNGVGKLTCPNIQHQHKGTYSCEAIGRNITKIATVSIYVAIHLKNLYEDKHCILPYNPANGKYTVPGGSSVDVYPNSIFIKPVFLNYTCNAGYKLIGSSSVYCSDGWWSADFPKCVSQCPLSKHPSIVYWCLAKGPLLSKGEDQECEELVPDGAIVRPECRQPNYHYTGGFLYSTTHSHYDYGVLTLMNCVDGIWNYIPTCSPKCGLVTAKGVTLVTNGTSAVRGELPWHAAIYRKTTTPLQQICGGSLISNTVIISAAHCFWSDLDKQIPAANYAAALGKRYRPWNDKFDIDVQKFNIRDIKIPPRFQGARTNFQDDLAVVILESTVVYSANVLPVCVDFNANFERRQLTLGKSGKVAGWGITSADGVESPVLKVTKLPFIDVDRCFADSPLSFHSYITSDKFCAGYFNSTGSALCKGDSGGGLVFASREQDTELYYLRGVVSTAPNNNHACITFVYTTFTQVSKFESFIQDSIN